MRVALVHDWLTGMRGGERVLESLVSLFPAADIFTLVHVPGSVAPAIEARPIRTSFIQRLPGAPRRFRQYLPLFPLAVRRFDLRGYDLVLATSHCVAVGARPARRRRARGLLLHADALRLGVRARLRRAGPAARAGGAPGCPCRAAPVGPRGGPARGVRRVHLAARRRADRARLGPRGARRLPAGADGVLPAGRAGRRRRRLSLRVGADAVQAARRRGGRVHRARATPRCHRERPGACAPPPPRRPHRALPRLATRRGGARGRRRGAGRSSSRARRSSGSRRSRPRPPAGPSSPMREAP